MTGLKYGRWILRGRSRAEPYVSIGRWILREVPHGSTCEAEGKVEEGALGGA